MCSVAPTQQMSEQITFIVWWKTNKILHIPKNSLEIHPPLHLPEDTRAMFDLNKLDYKVLRINHSLSFLCTGLQSFKKFSIKVKLGT